MRPSLLRAAGAAAAAGIALSACSTGPPAGAPTPPPPSGTAGTTVTPGPSGSSGGPTSAPTTQSPPGPPTGSGGAPAPSTGQGTTAPARGSFDAARAVADVRFLAGRIGPRLATGPAFRRAGRVVERHLRTLGYDVRREIFHVPAGSSWGVPVRAGRSFNVVAEPDGFDPDRPHVVLGAHLDTVAVAPGAEDNASGVAVLLELARVLGGVSSASRLPVVLVAFGAEEPRGTGDDLHHFGSQHHVRALSPARRESLRAMVSLDRVGVGRSVPVCTGPLSPSGAQRALLRTAERVDVPAHACENTASDHWSFEKAGFTVARLGSTSYAAYHSAEDLPGVVDRAQLRRTGRLVLAWLR